MSKPEKEKVTVSVNENDTLQALDVPGLIVEYRKYRAKEKAAEKEVATWTKNKSRISEALQVAAKEVGADILTYSSSNHDWKVTIVSGDTPSELNVDKLRENLMKMGKLSASVITQIIEASTDPGKPKKSYVLVTNGE